jgi:hypothetical protein
MAAAKHIADLAHDPEGPGADKIILGFLNLGMLLAVRLAKAEGETSLEKVGEVLRELSRELPKLQPDQRGL